MQKGLAWRTYLGALVFALSISWPSLASLPPPDFSWYAVFFKPDSVVVDEAFIQIMKQNIIPAASGRFDGPITLYGHCDTEETDVSLARAEAVKAKLLELGVPASRISVHSRGDNALLVRTPPGVSEPQNRRVEIQLERLCGKSCPPETYRDSGSSRD